MGKVRQLDQIEADIESSRVKYQHLLDFLSDKPLLLEEIKFVFTTLSDKIASLEALNDLWIKDSESNIERYHLRKAIENLFYIKYREGLTEQKQIVLEELLNQQKLWTTGTLKK